MAGDALEGSALCGGGGVGGGAGVSIRRLRREDVATASELCERAFAHFNATAGLAPEFPPGCEALGIFANALEDDFQGFVAVDARDKIVGSNAVYMKDGVAGIGPISVDPDSQHQGVGKMLMNAVMSAAAERGVSSVRLLQLASNTRSFSLYLSLGFDPMPPCGLLQGVCCADAPAGFTCKPLTEDCVQRCSDLHFRACGTHRAHEIGASLQGPHPTCAVFDDTSSLVAYTSGTTPLGGHTVADSEEAFKALVVFQSRAIEVAREKGVALPSLAVHVSHAYPSVMRWLVKSGLRLQRQLTPMSYGPRQEPSLLYFPSIMY